MVVNNIKEFEGLKEMLTQDNLGCDKFILDNKIPLSYPCLVKWIEKVQDAELMLVGAEDEDSDMINEFTDSGFESIVEIDFIFIYRSEIKQLMGE
jgi:hypothetical protein